MIKAIIFDLDGTLLNTLHALSYAVSRTMNELGFGDVDEEHTRKFVGNGFRTLLDRALKFSGDNELKNKDNAYAVYQRIFEKECLRDVVAYEGIPKLLTELKAMGIKMAVLSNKTQARTEDNIYKIIGRDVFDKVYGERAGVPIKPDPTSLKMLADELGVRREECLFIGDTPTDILTAKGADIRAVAVTWGFRDRQEIEEYEPEYIAEKPSEILAIVKGLQSN